MFWRFGGYANISTLNNILEKPDVTLEEVLDEADLIQELKQSNSKLIEFLRDENVLRRLLEYVTAPETPRPEEDEEVEETEDEDQLREKSMSPFRRSRDKKEKSRRREDVEDWEKADKTRTKLAYTACEVLSSETWSITESLLESHQLLRTFWDFLRTEAPLDATEAGYFTKINETLLDKRTDRMVSFLQSLDFVIPAMLQHIDCAAIMDLLLKIISMEKSEGGFGVVDWLQSQDVIPRLLSFLEEDHPPSTQTAAGDFLKAIVTISANASQNEQSCIGPNNLTRQLVSKTCMEKLLSNMLRGGNPLTVGVGLIIEIIRKNNSDYDPDMVSAPDSIPSSNDPIYLGTMLRCFAERVPDFMELLLSPTHAAPGRDGKVQVKRKELGVAFGNKIEPLGFDRFKTCELMAELLHCSNMGLLNERGSEAYIRQRDEERERLRAQGQLKQIRPPDSAVTEFSEDSAPFTNGVSPLGPGLANEETRKLGVANNSSEDDGFEDVGHPAEEVDEIKDDFDEKPLFEIEATPATIPELSKSTKPRLDLDEEFVDEPLTSPRLEAVDEKDIGIPEDAVPEPLHPHSSASPTSPTSGLTTAVGSLAVDNDIAMTNHDSSSDESSDSTVPELPGSNQIDAAPPLPKRDQDQHRALEETDMAQDFSPHPEDKPAPLFAGGLESASNKTINTIQGEDGDSFRSINAASSDQAFNPQFEYDFDGQPMVGDFLKIMFVEHQVVPTILDFFFRFTWNNFLHNVVYDVVQQVFNGPMDRGYNRLLSIDLFQSGRITQRIIEGQAQSDEAQRKTNMRLGYMGHLTLVAEEVVKFSDRNPPELLSSVVLEKVTSQSWNEYVEHTLSETRERDNAILGGVRPDTSLGPRQAVLNAVNAAGSSFGGGTSSVLANAGLNGGATGLDSMDLASNGSGTSNGGFGLGSGSLLSGFGSSSDEEDEEMEEMEEGDTGAGQDAFLSSHLNSSTSPPSDPPPAPPPLNLPPSRARRQLAARLALHSQQKAEAEYSTGKDDTEPLSSTENLEVVHDDDSDDERHSWDGHDISQDDSLEEAEQGGAPESGSEIHVTETEAKKKSTPTASKHLDLEDFANSPAADADDTPDNDEDVEMRVALG
ncbi:uncharacterized protein KY384_004330 [Bacidia gigantensis]|uniref:uncharacterized protein n=1 Tax=Bacidia gigantensis TaxID=2732470 RepID=UPI001D04AF93|nr:uncharacterized protein KY384_004330 [Bacidia gigantensis]KAG8530973.1 hypothetical protein KY384_004330 [Bacidia gigantensis]